MAIQGRVIKALGSPKIRDEVALVRYSRSHVPIELADEALEDIRFLNKVDQRMVFDVVENQLVLEPAVETRNRKRLRPNPRAGWELRIGKLRVFYDIHAEDRLVLVKVVGWKEHNRLLVRGEEFAL